jgi:beta-lactamase class A
VHFGAGDVMRYSPIAAQHVQDGMSIRALCDAAVRYSDNTAADQLFELLGGPPGLRSFIRSLGDTVTDVSRIEPDLNTAVPGDVRDTTTARAWGTDLQQVVLGTVLPDDKRAILTDWLVRNTTGGDLIRAAAPAGWKVGDKTGNGFYGTRDDIAVLWPPDAAPIVLAVLSSRPGRDDSFDDKLIAQSAAVALRSLRA